MKKRVISLLLALFMMTSVILAGLVSAEEPLYSDVKTGRWSYADIMYVTEKGLMNGTSADKFAPAETMTRAMVVTVFYRLEGEPAVEYQPTFKDVKEGKWFTDAILWAAENKIVNGTGDGKYEPMANVTREQLATIIKRYADFKLVITDESADITGYADYKRVHDYAREALSWANAVGLITGKTETTLAPREGATREQFAAILRRYTEKDFKYILKYNTPSGYSQYTEKEYPLVTDADIYVAVDGDNSNPGTLDKPIATFEKAVELVRELKKTATDEIKVAFKAGNYGRTTVTLTEEDSGTEAVPITYCAYGDGEVIFQNGITITQDMFKDIEDADRAYFTDKYEDGIKKVELEGLLVEGDVISKDSQLVNNGQRMNPARYPNKITMGYSENFLTDPVDYCGLPDAIKLKDPIMIKKFKSYHTFENTDIIGYFSAPYMCNAHEIVSYDPETNIITFPRHSYHGNNNYTNQFTFFSNISEELDCVNEYWVDVDSKTLYVYTPDTDYVLTTRDLYVDCKADYVSFVGFEFCGSSGEFFHVEADHVTVKLCDMYVGGGLMALRVKGTYFTLSECELSNLAGGGILLEDEPEKVNEIIPNGSVIDNNSVHDYLLKYKVYLPAVRLFNTVGVKVSHNEIYNSTHSAIIYARDSAGDVYLENYYGGRGIDNIIEYNVIYDVCENSGDCGAIYTDRCLANPGNKVRFNLFYNIGTPAGSHQNALYYGDGAAYQEVYGNIFWDCGNNALNADGRGGIVKDNICIYVGDNNAGGITYGSKYRAMILEGGLDRLYQSPTWMELYNTRLQIPDINSEAGRKWQERWPKLYTMKDNIEQAVELVNDPDFILNVSYCEIKNNYAIGGLTNQIEESVEMFGDVENNPHYTIEENPLFTNPTLGDYSIREDADFLKIPYKEMGRY